MAFIHPIPALVVPVAEILVTARVDKLQVFAFGNQVWTNLKTLQVKFMPVQFIVKTKSLFGKDYLINALIYLDEFFTSTFVSFGRSIIFRISRKHGIMSQNILDIRVQKLLVLLLVIEAEDE